MRISSLSLDEQIAHCMIRKRNVSRCSCMFRKGSTLIDGWTLTYKSLQCASHLRYRLDLEESMPRHPGDEEMTFVRMKLGNRRLLLVIRFHQLQERKDPKSATERQIVIATRRRQNGNIPADVLSV